MAPFFKLRNFFVALWSDCRASRPLALGLAASGLLYALFVPQLLNFVSANSDSKAVGYDFFGLPRCGLAIRFGTNVFEASKDYNWYGPWATPWVTHPMTCIGLGVPLSYLPPQLAFWVFNTLNWLLHLGIIWYFGRQLTTSQRESDKSKAMVFFLALGFFTPWYVMYHQAQFHSLAVLALALVLAGGSKLIYGFALSAMSKPILAPAALVLLLRREWKLIFKIGGYAAFALIPFLFLTYDPKTGLQLGLNEPFRFFLTNGGAQTQHSVWRWNQQMSFATMVDEIVTGDVNLYIRYVLGALPILLGAVLMLRKKLELAVGITTLWFFILYARGHEYQLTLYVPLLVYLFVQPDGRYRTWFFVVVTLLLALPTTYPLYRVLYGFANSNDSKSDVLFETNRALYYLFVSQKPLCSLLLLFYVAKKEWPYFQKQAKTKA